MIKGVLDSALLDLLLAQTPTNPTRRATKPIELTNNTAFSNCGFLSEQFQLEEEEKVIFPVQIKRERFDLVFLVAVSTGKFLEAFSVQDKIEK